MKRFDKYDMYASSSSEYFHYDEELVTEFETAVEELAKAFGLFLDENDAQQELNDILENGDGN